MNASPRSLPTAPWVSLTLAALFWGGNAVAAGMAVGEISPMLLTFLRWLGAALLMLALFGQETAAELPNFKGHWLKTAALGASGFALWNGFLYTAAVYGASPINIGLMQGAMPMMVIVGAAIFFREWIGPVGALGIAITCGGVMVVTSGGSADRLLSSGVASGDAIMLFGCVLYAAYTLGLRTRPAIPATPYVTIMFCFAVLTAAPLAIGEAMLGNMIFPSAKGWAITAFNALIPSALAQIFFLHGVDMMGPGRAGAFLNLIPIFAVILSVLVLGLVFEPFHALAMALVLGGLWLSQHPK